MALRLIRGHQYRVVFGLVEKFILPFVLDPARPGAAIRVVKELLGPPDITPTMRYAHLSPADLRDAVAKPAPKKARDPAGSRSDEKEDGLKSCLGRESNPHGLAAIGF